jgi:hypothetical protein
VKFCVVCVAGKLSRSEQGRAQTHDYFESEEPESGVCVCVFITARDAVTKLENPRFKVACLPFAPTQPESY